MVFLAKLGVCACASALASKRQLNAAPAARTALIILPSPSSLGASAPPLPLETSRMCGPPLAGGVVKHSVRNPRNRLARAAEGAGAAEDRRQEKGNSVGRLIAARPRVAP